VKNHVYYHVWIQDEIAKAYDVTQAMVSNRIKLHEFPDRIKEFINQNLITETQLIQILPLSINLYFSPWLTTDQVRMKCAESINQHTEKKSDEKRLKPQSEVLTSFHSFRLGTQSGNQPPQDHKSKKGSKPKTLLID
jgi:hypothetical protein